MPKTILFDFDGTIADTVSTGVAAFNKLARQHDFEEITPDNAEALRTNGPRAAMKELRVPMLRVPLVLRTLRKGIRTALPRLGTTDGMRDAIAELRGKGYRLGIVTSNSEENVRMFLENNNMEDWFDFLSADIGVFRKSVAIKKTIAHEALANDETVFVGDEIRDVEAAKKNGIKVVGVTWGLNSREGLAMAGPDHIVGTARELVALF